MQETYITLEEAARFEGISYKGLTSRISRNPARYKTRTEDREGGGKELVLLSTASLSQKGRRAYRAQIRAMAEPEEAGETAPWYVEADLGSYIEQHKRAYYEAVELARRVHARGLDVTVFTGYTWEQLLAAGDPAVRELLGQTDLLVDGPYLEEQRDLTLLFRGSANQRLIDVPRSLALPPEAQASPILWEQAF